MRGIHGMLHAATACAAYAAAPHDVVVNNARKRSEDNATVAIRPQIRPGSIAVRWFFSRETKLAG